ASYLVAGWDAQPRAALVDGLERFWLDVMAADPCRGGALRPRLDPMPLLRPGCVLRRPLATLGRFAGDLWHVLRDRLAHVRRAFGGAPRPIADRVLDLTDFSTVLAVDGLMDALRAHVDFAALTRSSRRLRITTTGWDGKVHLFEGEEMDAARGPEIVRASCAIPGMLPSVVIDGARFVDGSMLLYAPVQPAIEAGVDEIHLVHMNTHVASEPVPRAFNSTENLFRSLVMMWNTAIEFEVERVRWHNAQVAAGLIDGRQLTLHRYYPLSGYEGTMSFTNLDADRLQESIEAGLREARDHDCERCGCVLPTSG
ncbi:MAG: patatin-like phospholipase family protein, partial [Acidobacteriota bacterium]